MFAIGKKPRLHRAALLCVALSLLFAGSGSAGQWYYRADTNWGWLGPGHYDASCIWYYGQASCSGWNYWVEINILRDSQHGTILVGFENNATIRGRYVAEDVSSKTVTPSELSMGPYVVAHGTWWFGENVYLRLAAYA